MALVIDASVGLKWVLQEDDSDLAQALAVSEELLAPDFWLNEACNVLWLQVRKRVFTPEEAREGLSLLRAQVEPTPTGELHLHEIALEISLAVNHSPYDTSVSGFRGRHGSGEGRGRGPKVCRRHACSPGPSPRRHAPAARQLGTGASWVRGASRRGRARRPSPLPRRPGAAAGREATADPGARLTGDGTAFVLLLRPSTRCGRAPGSAEIVRTLAQAAGAMARLDQALAGHPLRPAFLYRARLEAVRRQAAVDGQAIDPWHLAAVLEGLRLRMEFALRIIDRGTIFDAARHALYAAPVADRARLRPGGRGQAGREAALAAYAGRVTPLLAAAAVLHAWLGAAACGGGPPLRAALVRHWTRSPSAAGAGAADRRRRTAPGHALGGRATGCRRSSPRSPTRRRTRCSCCLDLERAWFAARGAVAGRRRNSRAAAADRPAGRRARWSRRPRSPPASAWRSRTPTALLDRFCAESIAVEVTHRSKRRLFGLAGLAPLRDGVGAAAPAGAGSRARSAAAPAG